MNTVPSPNQAIRDACAILARDCNFHVNGQCTTHACMAKDGHPGRLERPIRFVGCENYRAIEALKRSDEPRDQVSMPAAGQIVQRDGSKATTPSPEAAAGANSPPETRGHRLTQDEVEWVVNDIAELGVKIGDQFFWLYKGESLVYGTDADLESNGVSVHDDGTPMHWRRVFKREFGECCHPVNYEDLRKCGHQHLIGTVSLNDGGDWKPLPSALNAGEQSPTTDASQPLMQTCPRCKGQPGEIILFVGRAICGECKGSGRVAVKTSEGESR